MRDKESERLAVQMLVQLGGELLEESKGHIEELLIQCRPYAWINKPGIDTARRISSALSQHELCCLVVGVTYAERELSWTGGSVGIVSTLFRFLQATSPKSVYEPIADWVIENRGNPYIPYGTQMYMGHTHAECMEYKRQKAIADAKFSKQLEIFTLEAQLLRSTLAKRRANTAEDRGTPKHREFVSWMSRLPIVEQLEYMAADEVYSIGFYPKNIPASATLQDVKKLDFEVAVQLRMKMIGKTWGPWKNLKRLLAEVGVNPPAHPSVRDFR
jgi:hypothetical protein